MKTIPLKFFFNTISEDLDLEEVVDEMRDFDERFVLILKKHLAVLGWWCFINVLTGVAGLIFAGDFWWYFFLMNITWAIINFGVVRWIFDHIFFQRFKRGNIFQRLDVQRHVEKMIFANIGLDVAYIFCGLFFLALSNQTTISYPELWQGFSISIMIQGAYLFAQDIFVHQLHHQNFKMAKTFFEDLLESQVAYRQHKK